MTLEAKGPPRRGADGPGNAVCFGGEHFPDSALTQKYQAQNLVRRPGARLRLVHSAPPPRPRRIDVQITARDGPSPCGRTRPFRLTDDDLDELIDIATRMERRR